MVTVYASYEIKTCICLNKYWCTYITFTTHLNMNSLTEILMR